jgi:hypothetical protein
MIHHGWECPRCGLVMAPSIVEHRCDDPPASFPWAPAGPAPFAPWPVSANHTIWPQPVTITTSPAVVSIAPYIGYVNPGCSTAGGTTAVCQQLDAA